MAGPVSPSGMAPAYACASTALPAVTSNWTCAAVSQQQEELAPALPQALALVSLMLVTTTLEAAAAGKPTREATQLAKAKAAVTSAFTPHSSSWEVTTWQP